MAEHATSHLSLEISDWLQSRLLHLSFDVELPKKLALGCFSTVFEHHRSIAILAEMERFASAFALLRPAMDALMRGYWLAHHATEAEARNVLECGDPPSTTRLIAILEQGGTVLPIDFAKRFHQRNWASMCDFTHTGIRQIARQFNDDVIKPNFPPGEVRTTLWRADTFAFLAGAGVAEVGSHGLVKQEILSRALEGRATKQSKDRDAKPGHG